MSYVMGTIHFCWAVSRYPAATCLAPEFAGSVVHTYTVSVRPTQGPESALLSRIRCVRLRADSGQTHEASENSLFPRFRHQHSHLRFPPHHLPRRTVLDSSSNFWSSNFWSDPTTFVGSPTAVQERKSYPRKS